MLTAGLLVGSELEVAGGALDGGGLADAVGDEAGEVVELVAAVEPAVDRLVVEPIPLDPRLPDDDAAVRSAADPVGAASNAGEFATAGRVGPPTISTAVTMVRTASSTAAIHAE